MKHELKAKLHNKLQEFLDDDIVQEHWGGTFGMYMEETSEEATATALTEVCWAAIECMIHQRDLIRGFED